MAPAFCLLIKVGQDFTPSHLQVAKIARFAKEDARQGNRCAYSLGLIISACPAFLGVLAV